MGLLKFGKTQKILICLNGDRMNNETQTIKVCSKCGSDKISITAYVNINTEKVTMWIDNRNVKHAFCSDCAKYTEIQTKQKSETK